MPRRRNTYMQSPPAYIPEREWLEAVRIDGVDPQAEHRDTVRALNTARQEAERQAERQREPVVFSPQRLADQARRGRLGGLYRDSQAMRRSVVPSNAREENSRGSTDRT